MSPEITIIAAVGIGFFSLAFGIYAGRKFSEIDNSLTEIENQTLRATNRRLYKALHQAYQQQEDTQTRLEKVLETRQNLRNWN